jgi:prepilin-type N-terminal cleavage/methylation domain-containing protein
MVTKNSRGFTLVELSIVLLVIGLIVGGVVSGQSLITSAKRNSIISELRSHEVAINAFKLQYDYFPGDFPDAEEYWDDMSFLGTPDYGNGNGIVQAESSSHYESVAAWHHLDKAGLVDIQFNFFGDGHSYNNTWPTSKGLGSDVGYYYGRIYNSGGSAPDTSWASGHGLILGSSGFFYVGSKGVMTPAQARNIDEKIDDGMPGTGKILGRRNRGGVANTCSDAWNYQTTPPTEWHLEDTTKSCTLIYLIH